MLHWRYERHQPLVGVPGATWPARMCARACAAVARSMGKMPVCSCNTAAMQDGLSAVDFKHGNEEL